MECGRLAGARLLVAMQSLGQENRPYTSAVRAFAGGGSLSFLRVRDLAEASEMGLGGSLLVVAAALAAVFASLLRVIPLYRGIQRMVVGPGRALISDLR